MAQLVDGVLEASVAGSFSRVGYAVRSRLEPWPDLPGQLGRVHLVTGASSGIGRAVAIRLAGLGAEVWLVGRDEDRTEASAAAARAAGGQAEAVLLDVTDPQAVDTFCSRFAATHDRLHGLVHAAGALTSDYRTAADGMESTVATAVLGPFRLTRFLAPLLRSGAANVVTVSSGGMYAEPFDVARLVSDSDDYDGVRAYARAKRAQVVLAHEWARRLGPSGVASYACHPGWVDTPGLATGLPFFSRLGPLLRTADQGADTATWLATGGARHPIDGSSPVTEGFFHDRRLRTEHRLRRTRLASTSDDGTRLWAWCEMVTGADRGTTA